MLTFGPLSLAYPHLNVQKCYSIQLLNCDQTVKKKLTSIFKNNKFRFFYFKIFLTRENFVLIFD